MADDVRAQLTVDAPMRLAGPEGPTIGFLRRGTRPVLERVEGSHVWLDARFPAVARSGEFRGPWQETGPFDGLRVVIESRISSATGASAPNATAPEDVRWGLNRELSVTRSGPAFAFVNCGRFRVLEQQGDDMRVAAEYGAGELQGWTKVAGPHDRDDGCEVSLMPSLPLGYRPLTSTPKALLQLTASPRQLSIVGRENGAFVCQKWQLEPTVDGRGHLVAPQSGSKRPGLALDKWHYSVHDLVLAIAPLYLDQDGGTVTSSAMRFLAVVGTRSDAIDVIETEAPASLPRPPLVGYRASAAQRWYLSPTACEAAIQYLARATPTVTPVNHLAPP